MPVIVAQPTPEELKKRLIEQLEWAEEYRKRPERQWLSNGQVLDEPSGSMLIDATLTFDNAAEFNQGAIDSSNIEIGINYAFKHTRFIHSQMSANPPSVVISPTSSDPQDYRTADAVDRILRFIGKKKNLKEVVDQANLKMLKKSIGWVKVFWDPNAGEILEFNPKTREVIADGDVALYSPATEDVWIDPDATRWEEIKYTYERLLLTREQALLRFPDSEQLIEHSMKRQTSKRLVSVVNQDKNGFAPMLEVFEYYEKGSLVNGGEGLRVYMLRTGEFLEDPTPNPHFKAGFPLKAITYLDMEESLYGKSVVDYASPLQDTLNRTDTAMLENLQAHNVVRFILPKGGGVEEEAVSNTPFDYIVVNSPGEAPHMMAPAQLMPDGWKFRQALVDGIQEMFGINDSMLGIQRREQSAVSQQTSVEQGTAIHRRLFVKSAMLAEEVNRDIIGLVQKHWTEKRTIRVMGKEKAFEEADFKGSDIANGFDFSVEHGTSLPLDPNARRDFLLLNLPMFKEAGLTPKQLLHHMRLDDVQGALDRTELAADRQREIYEEMSAAWYNKKPIYIAPEPGHDHLSYLEYARVYIETSEFKYLPEEVKELIRQHNVDRKNLAAEEVAPPPTTPPAPTPDISPFGMPGVEGALPPELGAPLV